MSDLVTFIRARLDEDERIATALPETHRAWRTTGGYPETGVTQVETADGVLLIEDDSSWAVDSLPHIARHDPARVLREVEAKRETVGWCTEIIGDRDLTTYGQFGALAKDPQALAVTLAVETLRLLAAVWSDHPDYQAEWAP